MKAVKAENDKYDLLCLQELHNVSSTISMQQPLRTDLHFLTLSRRKKTQGGFSSNASTNTAAGQCSLPVPDISQPTLETEKCSQDEPPSLLCVGDGGAGSCGGIKKIPPKVAPKPRHSLIIPLIAENKRLVLQCLVVMFPGLSMTGLTQKIHL